MFYRHLRILRDNRGHLRGFCRGKHRENTGKENCDLFRLIVIQYIPNVAVKQLAEPRYNVIAYRLTCPYKLYCAL